MISLKDYATAKNVSYEAIRKQVNHYKKELQPHILKVGRTKYLNDKAVEFLDSKRQSNPVIITESNKTEEIQRLEMENKNLLIKIAELQDCLIKEKEQVKILQSEKIELLNSPKKKTPWWPWNKKQ